MHLSSGTLFPSPAVRDVLSSQMSWSTKMTHRRKNGLFFSVNFGTLLLRVPVRNNLEHTSSPVRATHPDGSRRHRRVSGPEFQFRQIKACRFRTFSRLAERSWECIRQSPATWNFPHIPEMLLCHCAICWMSIWTLVWKKKTTQKHRRYAGCNP